MNRFPLFSRRAAAALVAAVLVVAAPAIPPPASADPPVPLEDQVAPGEPSARDFPKDFLPLLPLDRQHQRAKQKSWKDPRVGGWGGNLAAGPSCAGSARGKARRPIVLVHGNFVDAEFWRSADTPDGSVVNVRSKLLAAGYSPCDLWAISYTGASGYATYNDINVEELWEFLSRLRSYLGAPKLDVVTHSLGVTVVRKTAFVHPELYRMMGSFIAIAGANHGTTTCRGLGQVRFSYVCEEAEPGSAWLAQLNAGRGAGETPPGPRYMALFDGQNTDQFYLGPDSKSPELRGNACNFAMTPTAHNTLARGAVPVAVWSKFLRTQTCGPDLIKP